MSSKDFARFEPIFDKAAKATIGLENPPFDLVLPKWLRSMLLYTILGGGIGATYGLFQASRKKGSRKDKPPESQT